MASPPGKILPDGGSARAKKNPEGIIPPGRMFCEVDGPPGRPFPKRSPRLSALLPVSREPHPYLDLPVVPRDPDAAATILPVAIPMAVPVIVIVVVMAPCALDLPVAGHTPPLDPGLVVARDPDLFRGVIQPRCGGIHGARVGMGVRNRVSQNSTSDRH